MNIGVYFSIVGTIVGSSISVIALLWGIYIQLKRIHAILSKEAEEREAREERRR